MPRQKKKILGVRPMLLELDLSKREVLHLLAPLVSSYACESADDEKKTSVVESTGQHIN